MGSLGTTDERLTVASLPDKVDWNERLDQVAFPWRGSDPFGEAVAMDHTALTHANCERQAVISTFSKLLAESVNIAEGYASIYAKICSSTPEDAARRNVLTDSLTIAVAASLLHIDASNAIENFNRTTTERFIEPVHSAGTALMQTLETADSLSRDEFEVKAMGPMMRFFNQVKVGSQEVINQLRGASKEFKDTSSAVLEKTARLIAMPLSAQSIRGITRLVDKTQTEVDRRMSSIAHSHKEFLLESGKMVENMLFAP